ncbi:hypothetical protein D4R52_00215 [bacterium]|nr:MAG: hypothetical protein D4R52_00215 [bacterium]
MLDKIIIEQNKQKLLALEESLKKLISRVGAASEGATGFQASYEELGNKEDDNALEVEEYAEHVAEGHDLEERLKSVRSALERIEKGTYGICQKGGEEISRQRLEAVPEAANCVDHDSR